MTIIITDRPTAKAIGHTDYERYRRRQIAYGRWNRWTDPEPIREHILALRRHGMGRDSIARAAGVTEHTIRRVVNRQTGKVHVDTANRIVAIVDPTPPYVNATGARRRLQALGTLGWDQCTLAARIGWTVGNLNLIVSGRRKSIVPDTNDRIHRLYEHLSTQVAPDGYAASRARSSAQRNNWVGPLAWDDDTIDDPNAAPDLGGDDTGLIDEVAVRRALEGERVRLTTAERLHAFRVGLAAGLSGTDIGLRLHLSGTTARRIAEQARTAKAA